MHAPALRLLKRRWLFYGAQLGCMPSLSRFLSVNVHAGYALAVTGDFRSSQACAAFLAALTSTRLRATVQTALCTPHMF
jgi:hypothetical protein